MQSYLSKKESKHQAVQPTSQAVRPNLTENSQEVTAQRALAQLANASTVNFPVDVKQLTNDKAGKGLVNETSKAGLLAVLKSKVNTEADKILAQIDQDSSDCPYIRKWFAYYADKDAGHLSQAIERFAPATKGAETQEEYLNKVVEKVKTSLQKHVSTGTMEDVPAEIVDQEHEPEDFLHIALEKSDATAQLSCLLCCGDEDNGQQQPQLPPRLWNNIPAVFDSQNVDKDTQQPKGANSHYTVTANGVKREKHAVGETYDHSDRHICYVWAGSFGATRAQAFELRNKDRQKIVLDNTYHGPGVQLLLGNGGDPMIVSLTPIANYRVVDFDYNPVSQTISGVHVGHPVNP